MNKTVVPPSGDKHAYMSWAPYWWPDCSDVGNTTVLPKKRGLRPPPIHPVPQLLMPLVVYTQYYMNNAVHYIDTWFINPNTFMYPHLDFAQGRRGVGGNNGSYTGVL